MNSATRERCQGEDGILTLFTCLVVVAFLVLAGLTVDGGYVLAARRQAIDEANSAARAGAEALSSSAYRTTGQLTVDPDAARAAAQGFLSAAGHSGTVSISGNQVAVTLNFDQPMSLLRIIGINSVNVQGRGVAHSFRGIDTEDAAP